MTTRFRRLGLAAALAVATAAIAAGGALADQTYSDPRGDAGPGTDITGATIRNDQAGLITMQFSVGSPLVGNHALFLYIDADKNSSTGDPDTFGADYAMYAFPSFGALFQWTGSSYSRITPPSFSSTPLAGNVQQFTINRADLMNTTGFNFVVFTLSIDESGGQISLNTWDVMPDSPPLLTYDLAFPQCSNAKDDDGDGKIDSADLGCSGATDEDESDDPVNIRLGKAKTTPAVPKAGRIAVVSAATTRVETGQALDSGTVTCKAKIVGGAALKGTGKLVAGRAQCKFKIPPTAKKKTVRGQITMVYETATAKTPFTFRTAA